LRAQHGVAKSPRLGQRGGKGSKKEGVLSASPIISLPGQFYCQATVAQRCLRASGQEPGEVVLDFRLARRDLKRLLELRYRLSHFSPLRECVAEIKELEFTSAPFTRDAATLAQDEQPCISVTAGKLLLDPGDPRAYVSGSRGRGELWMSY
jgi:hypothetical protein